ncbi:MAG: hypothetical protein JWO62_2558 [Acidimicrobiaceae bacterium]|nr:hypothetical protein [Acidimicrobiaceae bacterium]
MIDRIDVPLEDALDQAMISLASEISESRFYAAWNEGIEHALWREMTEGSAPSGDQNRGSAELVELLFAIARHARRWPIWDDETDGVAVVSFDDFEVRHRTR